MRAGARCYDALPYVVEHCCGLRDRDWSQKRMHCDNMFLHAFAKWSNTVVITVSVDSGPEAQVTPGYNKKVPVPTGVLYVLYDNGVYLGVRGRQPVDQEHMLRAHILALVAPLDSDPLWNNKRLDVWTVAHSVMYSNAKELCANFENDADGNVISDSSQGDCEDVEDGEKHGRTLWEGRVIAMTNSPHPRVGQGKRLDSIAQQWHDWVTVLDNINGIAMGDELLGSGALLPRRHCFWRTCT